MKKNEARLVPAKNCSRNGLPSWGVWSNTTTVMHHAFTQSIQLIRSFIAAKVIFFVEINDNAKLFVDKDSR